MLNSVNWLSTCLEFCKVDGSTDVCRRLLSLTDRANVSSRPVDGHYQMELQPSGGRFRLLLQTTTKAQNSLRDPPTFVSSLFAIPGSPRTWGMLTITWWSSQSTIRTLRKEERDTGSTKRQFFRDLVGATTFWQECSCWFSSHLRRRLRFQKNGSCGRCSRVHLHWRWRSRLKL